MCDISGKLIAWMDGELAENEAVEVERLVRDCSECRSHVDAFGEVSRLVITYYFHATAAAAAPRSGRKLPRWIPTLAGAAAIAAMLLFALRPAAVKPIPVVARAVASEAAAAPNAVGQATKVKSKAVHRHSRSSTRRNSNTDWALANPAFQMVIPADAMFAPGAVPEGTIFRADLSMASDGSVQGLRLLQ